jgi:predicted small secreted protein
VRKRLAILTFLAAFLFAACNPSGGGFDICSAVSVVQTQQTVVQTAAKLLIGAGSVVPVDMMAKAKASYAAWYDAQALLGTSLTAINDSGGNPGAVTLQQYMQLLQQVTVLAADFMFIYNSVKNMKPLSLQVAAATPAPGCTMSDAQISAALAAQTWTQLGGA